MKRNLGSLFSELRRRHVFEVAAGYIIVGWFVIRAAEILVPNLMLPEWLTRAIIVLVILGFPIALVLAWAYDVTRTLPLREVTTELYRGWLEEEGPEPDAGGVPRERAPSPIPAPRAPPQRVSIMARRSDRRHDPRLDDPPVPGEERSSMHPG